MIGNVRVTFADNNADGVPDRKSINHYYSFGMEWNNRWELSDTISPLNLKRYNGKEYVEEMKWNNLMFGSRMMDPALGRWWVPDILAHKMPSWSSYAYGENNPIRMIDPDGRAAVDAVDGDPIKGFFKATGAYLSGVANAVGSNSLLGAGRQDPSTFGEYASWAQAGQTSGDVFSVVQGGIEMAVGGGGTAVATSTGVGVVATPATVGLAVHGATTTGTALSNLLNPSRVEARGQNSIPDTGGPSNGTQSNKPNTTSE